MPNSADNYSLVEYIQKQTFCSAVSDSLPTVGL